MNMRDGSSTPVSSETLLPARSKVSRGFARMSANARPYAGLALLMVPLSLWACSDRSGITAIDKLNGPGDSTITLTLDVTEARVFEGQTLQLELTVRKDGTVIDPATAGLTIVWMSEDASTASVNTRGLLEGMAEGQTRIVASSQGQEVSASVIVAPGLSP